MKIFAIRESNDKKKDIGFLFYYEKAKEFYIEILDNLDDWDVPLLLSSLYKKGLKTINSYWSKVWVQQRIVPSDRQNIGQILRDNKLKVYDNFIKSGVVRIDYLCDSKTGEVWINEVNTIPGSLSFYLWKDAFTFTQLLDGLIESAISDNQSKNSIIKTFDSSVLTQYRGRVKGGKL